MVGTLEGWGGGEGKVYLELAVIFVRCGETEVKQNGNYTKLETQRLTQQLSRARLGRQETTKNSSTNAITLCLIGSTLAYEQRATEKEGTKRKTEESDGRPACQSTDRPGNDDEEGFVVVQPRKRRVPRNEKKKEREKERKNKQTEKKRREEVVKKS